MAEDVSHTENVRGFKGAVTGLPLSDVIQLKGHNMFTGCIFVNYGDKQGVIYFQDGEIVHAEQGRTEGERAFYEIISWPGGRFDIEAKIISDRKTIDKRLTHLLLDAHRMIDEGKIDEMGGEQEKVDSSSEARPRLTANSVCLKLMSIPGVAYAVMFGADGVPVEDGSSEALALSVQGHAMVTHGGKLGEMFGHGGKLGELFGVGGVKSLAVQDRKRQLLLFEVRNFHLILAIKGNVQLAQVEAELRKSFAAKK